MRIGNIIAMTLMVSAILILVGLIYIDMQNYYPATHIDNSSWGDIYTSNWTEQIKNTSISLQIKLEGIKNADKWYGKIAEGLYAIPVAILEIPSLIFGSLFYSVDIISGMRNTLGIPIEVFTIGVVGLLVGIVLSVINWWHSKTPT